MLSAGCETFESRACVVEKIKAQFKTGEDANRRVELPLS
jgi:hypothetical protein